MREPPLDAKVVHRTAGRARLRFPGLRGAEERLGALAARLAAIPGITQAAPHPLTGSIVVHHRAAWPAVAAAAADACAIAWQDGTEDGAPAPAALKDLDPRTLLGGGLALLALLQLARRQVLPPALTLLWYAATLAGDRLQAK